MPAMRVDGPKPVSDTKPETSENCLSRTFPGAITRAGLTVTPAGRTGFSGRVGGSKGNCRARPWALRADPTAYGGQSMSSRSTISVQSMSSSSGLTSWWRGSSRSTSKPSLCSSSRR